MGKMNIRLSNNNNNKNLLSPERKSSISKQDADSSIQDSEFFLAETFKNKKELELKTNISEFSYFELEDEDRSARLKTEFLNETQENEENANSLTKNRKESRKYSKKMSFHFIDLDKKDQANDNLDHFQYMLQTVESKEDTSKKNILEESSGKTIKKEEIQTKARNNVYVKNFVKFAKKSKTAAADLH